MAKIIFGRNPVLEALKADQAIDKIFILHGLQGNAIREIFSSARQRNVRIELIDKQRLAQMTDAKNSQGIVASISEYQYKNIADILQIAGERKQPPLVALLDGIEDPHNLGAIIRSAECAGVHGVIIPKHRAVGLTETVAKTSAGALAHIAIARVTNLVPAIEELKQAGLWIAGTAGDAQQSLYQADYLAGPLAVVIGSEGKGIRRLIREKCDFLLHIPMNGKINSLNASVAAGVLLFEIVRQRLGS